MFRDRTLSSRFFCFTLIIELLIPVLCSAGSKHLVSLLMSCNTLQKTNKCGCLCARRCVRVNVFRVFIVHAVLLTTGQFPHRKGHGLALTRPTKSVKGAVDFMLYFSYTWATVCSKPKPSNSAQGRASRKRTLARHTYCFAFYLPWYDGRGARNKPFGSEKVAV